MAFVDHLEELRWNVLRSVIAIVAVTIVAFSTMDIIFHHVLLGPIRADFWTYRMMCQLSEAMCVTELNVSLQNRTVAGQFTMHIIAALITGVIVAFPYVFWEFWKFIKPGLLPNERRNASGAVFFVSFLFASGVLFGYFFVTPVSLNFLLNYKLDPSIQNQTDISSYISFVCMMVLGTGIMFQLPVAIYILTKVGIVGPRFLRKYRRHAIVVIFVVAAVFTPSPDFFTQLIVAIPLYILFELSIFVSAAVEKNNQRDIYNN